VTVAVGEVEITANGCRTEPETGSVKFASMDCRMFCRRWKMWSSHPTLNAPKD